MFTTAFLYDVTFYGLIAAVTWPAIDLLVFLIRSGRRLGREEFGMVRAPSEVTQDSNPPQLHIADHPTLRPKKQRQQGMETAAHPTPTSAGSAGWSHRGEKLCPLPVLHEKGYVASNGIMITPNVIGSGRRSMISPATSGVSVKPPAHPHAEYWRYGDMRFYEHE